MSFAAPPPQSNILATPMIGIPVVSKVKLPPQQHKLKQKSAEIMQTQKRHLFMCLLNRLCFCHIDFIFE